MRKYITLLTVLASFAFALAGNYALSGIALLAPWQSISFGAAGAELLERLFLAEIQPKLFPGNTFLSQAMNDDAYVNYNTVELAHSGTIPNASVDRSQLPALISQRNDAATNYTLEELTSDPTLLKDSESLVVAYNKRASILDQHAKTINTLAADRALYKWATGADSTRIVASTGATRTPTGPSQTGTRKMFTAADIIAIRQKFFRDDIINENTDVLGCALLTADQYGDLLGISNLTEAQKYGRATFPSGVIDRVLGFDIYVRSRAVVLNGSNALKAQGAAGATTDQDCAVFWHRNYVRRAVGAQKVFVNPGKAEYYGDLMSTLVRFGAAPVRNDNKGVYLLYESA